MYSEKELALYTKLFSIKSPFDVPAAAGSAQKIS